VTVEVLYHDDCPHARAAIELVHRCVDRLGLEVTIGEFEGDHPSPTVLVNGQDVMGDPSRSGRVCRLDLPTEERILEALRAAAAPAGIGTALKTILIAAAAAMVVCVSLFAWLRLEPRRVPQGQPPLTTLDAASLPAFRTAFNAGDGEVRVLAMLSPT
jgi:hypothetical protein